MNKQLLFLAMLTASLANAQAYQMTDKEKEKHMKEVAKSKEKGDALWDYDTVFNAGVPYCIVYKVDKGALSHDDYSVRSLTGVELIYVKYGTYTDYTQPHAPNTAPPTIGYYSYFFQDTKKTGEVLTTKVYKEVVKNNLIMNGSQVDPNAEAQFIAFNGNKYSTMQPPPVVVVAAPTGPNYNLVPRNHGAGISIILSDVRQDGVSIGSIQYNDSYVNGNHIKNMGIFLPNGTKVADVTNQAGSPHYWTIITMRDNMRGSVNTTINGEDNMDVVKYLINGNYL